MRTRTRTIFSRIGLTPVIAISIVLVSAVVSCSPGDGGSGQRFTFDTPGASSIFPSDSLTHWVSYAQQMSVVTVVGEERIEPPASVYENDEGYVGRTVIIRIDRTIWSAPGSTPFADGTELSYTGWGWLYKNGEYRPFAQQLSMGERYLMPIVKGRDDIYHPLTSDSRLPLGGNRVHPDLESNNPATKSTIGKTVDEVGAMLEATSPDPLALKYWHLEPVERVQAVLAEMYSQEDIEEPIPELTETSPEG